MEDQEKIRILGELMSNKEILFELVLSEFKEITPEFETNLNQYEDFKQKYSEVIMNIVANVSIFINIFLNLKVIIQLIPKKCTNILL